MLWCFLTVVSFVLFLAYAFFDVNYFIHTGFIIVYGRLFKKKRTIFDTTSIGGLCTSHDLDVFMRHMSNARFLRDLDFARFDFYFRTDLYTAITKKKGHALQGASTIRYRRPIPLFSRYKVQTKLLFWDEKNFYMEHQFITTADNFVRAIVMSKQTTINVTATELIRELAGDKYKEPVMPVELKQYLDSVETMSEKLRKKSD